MYLYEIKKGDGLKKAYLIKQIQLFIESLTVEKSVLFYESCNIYTISNAIEAFITLNVLEYDGQTIRIVADE